MTLRPTDPDVLMFALGLLMVTACYWVIYAWQCSQA
jgi:hypothetical protein